LYFDVIALSGAFQVRAMVYEYNGGTVLYSHRQRRWLGEGKSIEWICDGWSAVSDDMKKFLSPDSEVKFARKL
jgi:hypothetical protein